MVVREGLQIDEVKLVRFVSACEGVVRELEMANVAEWELANLRCELWEAGHVSGGELVAVENFRALCVHLLAAAQEVGACRDDMGTALPSMVCGGVQNIRDLGAVAYSRVLSLMVCSWDH